MKLGTTDLGIIETLLLFEIEAQALKGRNVTRWRDLLNRIQAELKGRDELSMLKQTGAPN